MNTMEKVVSTLPIDSQRRATGVRTPKALVPAAVRKNETGHIGKPVFLETGWFYTLLGLMSR
jgi:hypothetical protein